MVAYLHNQLRSFISPFLVSKFSKEYNETEVLMKKSIETSISTILIGLNNKFDDKNLYDELMEYISNSEFYIDVKFEATKTLIINSSFNKEGCKPLNLIFSNKKDRISEMISNEIGVKSETASAILNFSAMFVFSYFKSQNQNFKSLQLLINDQKRMILSTVPEGIRLLLGVSTFEIIEEKSESSFTSNIFSFFLG
ncbi:DUF937 domain-containing protein [Flavobacterium sinopsychrotolerans]|uniref:Uncharacterized protein n=1 Tax=Flavobacterium sinopsychrotolerans TaxID=604089 RepID=A0A1H8QGS5_9FLAO|nr:DUF937 domain-containing protein [Flavobacterium sinopsychrotolerans]SEO53430.1 hypothetical protein SAMN04487942_2989 [Flavobacterium sinopsychrotolerans]